MCCRAPLSARESRATSSKPVLPGEVWDTGAWECVYNLRVAEWHTYFVGDDHWGWAAWAHNANMPNANQDHSSAGVSYSNSATSLYGFCNRMPQV